MRVQEALLWPAARWLHGGGDAWSQGDLIHLRGLTFHGYHGVYPEVGASPPCCCLKAACRLGAAGERGPNCVALALCDVFALAASTIH